MKKIIERILIKIEEDKKKKRGFEIISFEQFEKDANKLFENKYSEKELKQIYQNIKIPKRGSKNSAGYDFYSPFDFTLKPDEIKIIPTGIKSYMNEDEFLAMFVRSSVGFKYNVRLTNQVGIIDSDYYNNEDNQGHIMISFQNHGSKEWDVKLGEKSSRVAQGVFIKYGITSDEKDMKKRTGGIGSTNK